MSATTNVVVASAVGTTLCAFFTGGNYTTTFHGLPALLLAPSGSRQLTTNVSVAPNEKPVLSPSLLARQRQAIYDLGMPTFAPMCIIAAASFSYCAYELPKSCRYQKQLYILATILNLSVAPFTLTMMKNANNELKRRAKLAEQGAEEDFAAGNRSLPGVKGYETGALVKWWGSLNAMRATMPLLAIVAAITALAL